MGTSIASIGDVNGDGAGDFAVGAFFDDDGGEDKGAVWLLFLDQTSTTSPSAAPARITELERPQRLTIDTELLANYPNPFNPETWIPYRLAEAANVTLTIYDIQGTIVRRIEVGHQQPAVYVSRDKAIYFDGRNNNCEQVSSGVYFYHLKAGDYSATRKMLILK